MFCQKLQQKKRVLLITRNKTRYKINTLSKDIYIYNYGKTLLLKCGQSTNFY